MGKLISEGWPKTCVLCNEDIVAGGEPDLWGMWWGGGGWLHYKCIELAYRAMKRIEKARQHAPPKGE